MLSSDNASYGYATLSLLISVILVVLCLTAYSVYVCCVVAGRGGNNASSNNICSRS